jgi:hypothetical protein
MFKKILALPIVMFVVTTTTSAIPFKITGNAVTRSKNSAFIKNTMKYDFDVIFKDENGTPKMKPFNLQIDTKGLNIGLAAKYNWIFFVNTDPGFFENNETVDLEFGGFDWGRGFLEVTYVTFKNHSGIMVIVSAGLSVAAFMQLCSFFKDPKLSTFLPFMPPLFDTQKSDDGKTKTVYLSRKILEQSISVVTGGTLKSISESREIGIKEDVIEKIEELEKD